MIEILGAETEYPSGDQFGEVTGGSIQLRGKAIPVITAKFFDLITHDDFQSEFAYYADDASYAVTSDYIWVLPITYENNMMNIFDREEFDLVCLVLEGNGRWDPMPETYSRIALLTLRCYKPPSSPSPDSEKCQQANPLAEIFFENLAKLPEMNLTIV